MKEHYCIVKVDGKSISHRYIGRSLSDAAKKLEPGTTFGRGATLEIAEKEAQRRAAALIARSA